MRPLELVFRTLRQHNFGYPSKGFRDFSSSLQEKVALGHKQLHHCWRDSWNIMYLLLYEEDIKRVLSDLTYMKYIN